MTLSLNVLALSITAIAPLIITIGVNQGVIWTLGLICFRCLSLPFSLSCFVALHHLHLLILFLLRACASSSASCRSLSLPFSFHRYAWDGTPAHLSMDDSTV